MPYRNTSLTKILKASLGGNTKTCVILCLSPTMTQFEHSLQTLKFGRSVSKIENRIERNVHKTTSEETLKLLIQEYQSRLELLERAHQSPSTELKAENDMLWQQFVLEEQDKSMVTVPRDVSRGRTLVQFYVDDSVYCANEPESRSGVVRTFVEALKVACKHTFHWKSKALSLEKQVRKMQTEIAGRNAYINKLLEVTEDCFRSLKAQVAKVEIYEQTDKWAQQLNAKALASLASHFKAKLQQIQDLIAAPKAAKEQPKLDLKLKYSEPYIVGLLKDGKAVTATPIGANVDTSVKRSAETESDKKLFNLVQSLKDLLRNKEKDTSVTEFKSEIELGGTPKHVSKHREVSPKPRTPNGRHSKFEYKNPPRQKTAKAESRPPSSNSRQGPGEVKLGAIIDKAVKVASTQKSTPRATVYNDAGNNPLKVNNKFTSEVYEIGAFSRIQSPQQLKKALKLQIKGDATEGENAGEILQTWQKLVGSIGLK